MLGDVHEPADVLDDSDGKEGERLAGEAGLEARDDEQRPRGSEEVSEGFADDVAEDRVRRVEVITRLGGSCRVGACRAFGEGGDEHRPSQRWSAVQLR